MAKVLDVYRDWLGIKDRARPLGHYQLLRLEKFTDSPSQIRSNYRQLCSAANKHLTGEQGSQVAGLVRELTMAMLCLTDVERKQEYDAKLGRTDGGKLRQRSFEEGLIASKVVDEEKLAKAHQYAEAVGLELRDAVLQQKLASPDIVLRAYAESVGMACLQLDDAAIAKDLVTKIPAAIGRQYSCVPLMADNKLMLLASPIPLADEAKSKLESHLKKKVRTVLCTPAAIHDLVDRYYPREAVAAEAAGQKREAPPDPEAPPPVAIRTPAQEMRYLRIMCAIIGFNITVIVTMLSLGFYRGGLYRMGYMDLVIGGLCGLVGSQIGRFLGPAFRRDGAPKRR